MRHAHQAPHPQELVAARLHPASEHIKRYISIAVHMLIESHVAGPLQWDGGRFGGRMRGRGRDFGDFPGRGDFGMRGRGRGFLPRGGFNDRGRGRFPGRGWMGRGPGRCASFSFACRLWIARLQYIVRRCCVLGVCVCVTCTWHACKMSHTRSALHLHGHRVSLHVRRWVLGRL